MKTLLLVIILILSCNYIYAQGELVKALDEVERLKKELDKIRSLNINLTKKLIRLKGDVNQNKKEIRITLDSIHSTQSNLNKLQNNQFEAISSKLDDWNNNMQSLNQEERKLLDSLNREHTDLLKETLKLNHTILGNQKRSIELTKDLIEMIDTLPKIISAIFRNDNSLRLSASYSLFNYPITYQSGGFNGFTFNYKNEEVQPYPWSKAPFLTIRENKLRPSPDSLYIFRETGMLGGQEDRTEHYFFAMDIKLEEFLFIGLGFGFGQYTHTGILTTEHHLPPSSNHNFDYIVKTRAEDVRQYNFDILLKTDLIHIVTKQSKSPLRESLSLFVGAGTGSSSIVNGIAEAQYNLNPTFFIAASLRYYRWIDRDLYLPKSQQSELFPLSNRQVSHYTNSGLIGQSQNRFYYGVTIGANVF